MKQVCPPRFFALPAALTILLLLSGSVVFPTGSLLGDEKTTDSTPPVLTLFPALATEPSPSGVAFLTPKTRLWLERSQVICFYAKDTPEEDRYLSFSADENFLHVLIPPTLVPGEHLGYIRVRPIKEGKTQLTLAGATISIEVVKDTAANTSVTRPQIVSPAQGAVVWGKFVVGVERLNLSTAAPPPPPFLRLPNGREIAAQNVPDQQPGPHLRYAFTVDADSLAPGPNELVAVFKDETGREIVSEPLDLARLDPNPAGIVSGDCKDQINTHWPRPKIPFAYPSGEFQALKPPDVITDTKSNLGQVVSSAGENPAWAVPVTVAAKGVYALVVTARGDIGGNALPTLGLMIDGAPNPASTVRLATTDWHRIPVGHPVELEPGEHVLSVRFRNGFGNGPNDNRHLYLAHYELARLDGTPLPALAANSAGSTMMQDAAATPFNQKPVPATASSAGQDATMQASAMQGSTMEGDAMKPATMQGSPMQSASMEGSTMQGTMAMAEILSPPGSFHIVFRDALDGQVIANQVQINAMCWWPDREHTPPPSVDLLVNGKVVASETSPRPHFRIDVAAFQPGENTVELQGKLPDGQRTHSIVEKIILPKGLDAGAEPYRPSYRFYVYDPAWGGSLSQRVNGNEPDPMAGFYTNGDASLKLPDALQGPSRISIEARGDDFNGPAVATVLLQANGQETKLADVPTSGKLATLPVKQITFAPGPKTLVVRYANDAYEKGKGDRNLFVRSIEIDPVSAQTAKTHPLAAIVYPAPGAKVGLADAVVANVSGNQGTVHADLLIDGQPQHFNLQATNGLGPILFPLLTRNLTAGPHQLQVALKDDAGSLGQSEKLEVTFTGQDEAASSNYSRALLLLNRFGYGPEPKELAAILTLGPRAWLEARVNDASDAPAEENESERLHAEFPEIYALIPRAVQYLVTDDNPVRARFLMWAENHFSTWANKDGVDEKSREHDRFLELGIAPFSDLLLASATSPAMLIYLDQRNSVTHRLNENYAREIMELHTLGVKGGYTQRDVTTLADLLTGWTLADEAPLDGSQNLVRTFRYNPFLNTGGACEVLGMEFPGVPVEHRFDRVLTALNMLSAHPSCALFISRKLAEHYVSDPAPPELVNHLAQIYLETGGDLREMLPALADEPTFWTAPTKVASPIDFSVRLARLAHMNNPGPVNDLISHSGMGMFDRATPDGYPDADGYFTSSNALLQRWHFAQTVQASFINNGLIPNDWRPADNKWDAVTTQRLVDLAAVRITGKVLGTDSNAAALQLIAAAPENTDARLHLLTTFLCQVPETSIR